MPRKLPWMNKGGGSRIQVKQPPANKQCAVSDIDDGFFDGTVLASSRKDQEPADESDNDFPDLPAEPSTPRTKPRKDALFTKRAQSSSPPPIADLEQPPIESMRMGVSKFDLRDDEWMMVEDEFLETAKLFTRHLHIAEYEKLKERIEEKKKEAKAARPVVANAKMSVEGAMKERATVQEQKQRKAIRDIYASHDDDGVAKAKSPFNSLSPVSSSGLRRPPNAYTARDTDSDDLDAAPSAAKGPKTTAATTPVPVRHPATTLSRSVSSHSNITASQSFAKPAIPSLTSKSRTSRINRATPFDMLDDYTPRKSHATPKPAQEQSESSSLHTSKSSIKPPTSVKQSIASPTPTNTNSKAGRSIDLFDKPGRSDLSEDTADRLAKRKAEREKEEKEKERAKRKAVKSDEIPTFLF